MNLQCYKRKTTPFEFSKRCFLKLLDEELPSLESELISLDLNNQIQIEKFLDKLNIKIKKEQIYISQFIFDFVFFMLANSVSFISSKTILQILNNISCLPFEKIKSIIYPNDFVQIFLSFFPNKNASYTLGNFIIISKQVAEMAINANILDILLQNNIKSKIFSFFLLAFSYHCDFSKYYAQFIIYSLTQKFSNRITEINTLRALYKTAKYDIFYFIQSKQFQNFIIWYKPKSCKARKYTIKIIIIMFSSIYKIQNHSSFYDVCTISFSHYFFSHFRKRIKFFLDVDFENTVHCLSLFSKNNSGVSIMLMKCGFISMILQNFDKMCYLKKKISINLLCNLILSSPLSFKWYIINLGFPKTVNNILLVNDPSIIKNIFDALRHILTMAIINKQIEIISSILSIDQLSNLSDKITYNSQNQKEIKCQISFNEFIDVYNSAKKFYDSIVNPC